MKTGTASASDAVALATLPFLKGLRPADLETLGDCAMRTGFAAGELVFREGDIANRFYVILKGNVALELRHRERAPVRIQTLGPGEVLGWAWLLPPYRWHFDARTLGSVSALFFYGTRLREYCETNPELGYAFVMRMAEVMAKRIEATQSQLANAFTLALRSQKMALRALGRGNGSARRGALTVSKPARLKMKGIP